MISPNGDGSSRSRPNVFVHLDYGRGGSEGLGHHSPADAFPYGYGSAFDYLALSSSRSPREIFFIRFARRLLAQLVGFDLIQAWYNRAAMSSADAVITHTEHEYLAIALLIKLRLIPRVPVIGQSIWLWDEWHRMSRVKRILLRWLLSEIAIKTTHSVSNARTGTQLLGEAVHLVPFGANPAFDRLTSDPRAGQNAHISVVAPGSDRHRDWRTLARVAARAPDLEITIVSRRLRPRLYLILYRLLRQCHNIRVQSARSAVEVTAIMIDNDVVAIPLKKNLHSSGVTVLYEAFAVHRPVAATNTGGLQGYGLDYVEWARPGDALSLLEAIRRAARRVSASDLNDAWKSVESRGLTLDDYGLRHVIAVWAALRVPVDLSLIERFSPILPLVRSEHERLRLMGVSTV